MARIIMHTEIHPYRRFFELFLISFLSLFLELALIRWVPGVVPSVAYFTNLVLIATFLGLGLGCALSHKKSDLLLIPVLFIFLIAFAIFLKHLGVAYKEGLSDFIFLPQKGASIPMVLAIPAVFFINFLIFVHIGMILGRCLTYFRPLVSYSVNIAGSIAGILFITFLSFRFMPPAIWFFAAFLGLGWFLRTKKLYAVLLLSAGLLLIFSAGLNQMWSPYYKIEVDKLTEYEFFRVTVNNSFLQQARDFRPTTINKNRYARHWKEIYTMPYNFAEPGTVLIVGAGVGNDVLIAQGAGAVHIDAVELDPGIINIGKTLHPDNPYGAENVTVFIDDARSFMNQCRRRYDLIVYGFLDSHALFVNMPSVRLDNFVYTIEGLTQARELLKEGGTLVLSFYVGREWVGNKIYFMLKEIFGKKPLVYASTLIPTERIFIVSLADDVMKNVSFPDFKEVSSEYETADALPLPTDTWPYFYLKNRTIPTQYLVILSIILIASIGTIIGFLPKRRQVRAYNSFFFLGAAFMLIETKSIVQLSLLFGTTWLVSAVIITSILLMILFANCYVIICKPKKVRLAYILLFLTLLINWLLPYAGMRNGVTAYPLLSVFLATLPLFFAAIIFAVLFKDIADVPTAFGMNLLGVVCGGFLEYLSLVIGLHHLTLIACALYFFSFLGHKRILSLPLAAPVSGEQ